MIASTFRDLYHKALPTDHKQDYSWWDKPLPSEEMNKALSHYVWHEGEPTAIALNFGHRRQAEIALARIYALRKLGLPTNNIKLSENQI